MIVFWKVEEDFSLITCKDNLRNEKLYKKTDKKLVKHNLRMNN